MASPKVTRGVNDVGRHAQLLSEWAWDLNGDLSPYEIRESSAKKVWWRCPVGAQQGGPEHVWQVAPNGRLYKRRDGTHTGCPYCSGQRVLAGFNDLRSQCPEVAVQYAGDLNDRQSDEITVMSNRRVWWRCDDDPDHVWQDAVMTRVQNWRERGTVSSCRFCANRKPRSKNK